MIKFLLVCSQPIWQIFVINRSSVSHNFICYETLYHSPLMKSIILAAKCDPFQPDWFKLLAALKSLFSFSSPFYCSPSEGIVSYKILYFHGFDVHIYWAYFKKYRTKEYITSRIDIVAKHITWQISFCINSIQDNTQIIKMRCLPCYPCIAGLKGILLT